MVPDKLFPPQAFICPKGAILSFQLRSEAALCSDLPVTREMVIIHHPMIYLALEMRCKA
jgi:hypothetical protein